MGQFDCSAQFFAHFPHRRGKTAGATVSDGGIKRFIARCFNHFNQALFGDRVTNLDGAAGGFAGVMGEFGGGEGRAVDAVATGASAQRHHQITSLGCGRVATVGQEADTATEDQRVAQIAFVIKNRAINRRQSQLVAIVTNAGHNAISNASGVENAGGQLVIGIILGAEAEDISRGDGSSRDADNVAHDAAHPGVSPAKRFQGRGMVVRLDFEGKIIVVIKGDNAGVIDKGRTQPGRVDLLRGGADILFE